MTGPAASAPSTTRVCGAFLLPAPQRQDVFRGRHADAQQIQQAYRIGNRGLRAASDPVTHRRERPGQLFRKGRVYAFRDRGHRRSVRCANEVDALGCELTQAMALRHSLTVGAQHVDAGIGTEPEDAAHAG